MDEIQGYNISILISFSFCFIFFNIVRSPMLNMAAMLNIKYKHFCVCQAWQSLRILYLGNVEAGVKKKRTQKPLFYTKSKTWMNVGFSVLNLKLKLKSDSAYRKAHTRKLGLLCVVPTSSQPFSFINVLFHVFYLFILYISISYLPTLSNVLHNGPSCHKYKIVIQDII